MAISPKNINNIVSTVSNIHHTHQIPSNIAITSGNGLWTSTSINTNDWKFSIRDTNIQQIYSRFNVVYNGHKGNYTGINWHEYDLRTARLGLVYFYESEHVRKDDRLFLHCFIDTITDKNTDLDGVRDIYESLSEIFFNITNSTTVEVLLRELLENGKPVIRDFFTVDTIDSLNPLVYTAEIEYLRNCLLMGNILGGPNEE